MDLSAYRVEEVPLDSVWDEWVEHSPQGTIFQNSHVLSALSANPRGYLISKANQPKALLGLMLSDDGQHVVPHGSVVYTGIMFLQHDKKQNLVQKRDEEFRISCVGASFLEQTYHNIYLSLSPNVTDIRPFIWHRYGEKSGRFIADVRYTSLIRLDGLQDDRSADRGRAYQEMGKSRRQELRKARLKGVTTESTTDIALFEALYLETFMRQGSPPPADIQRDLRRQMTSLLETGRGRLFISRLADGHPGSAAFFGVDSKRAYYIYGAADAASRGGHTGTAVLWDAMRALAKDGVVELDLEGVNSPLRGHFKLSFGGTLVPYYHLRVVRD